MANGTFKMKMDINHHGPRLMPNNCKNLNPPYFSLPTTFKLFKKKRVNPLISIKKICCDISSTGYADLKQGKSSAGISALAATFFCL
jgi:hypothetical protein